MSDLASARAALAWAVVAIESLGGCINPECSTPYCWLGALSGTAHEEAVRAIAFVTESGVPVDEVRRLRG